MQMIKPERVNKPLVFHSYTALNKRLVATNHHRGPTLAG